MNAEIAPIAVDLAREPDFRLGGLEARPSRREVVTGAGRTVLEPRVMQVLIALTRSRGEVVSRDDLARDCWGGRVVGEDALNRCVAELRRLADRTGAFEIETVRQVGYRLIASGAEPTSRPAPQAVLLAVLPFENLSDDRQLSYFSDGVSEEILQTLAQRTGLKVVGRSSSFQFRGADKAVPNVIRHLGVTHVLDGAVRRAGQALRISAQLIDGATQTTLWADGFEGEQSDVFALQDRVAAGVALALQRVLAPAFRVSAINPVVYDLYLRGSTQPNQTTTASLDAQILLLEEAVSREPRFAEAWGRLGFKRAFRAHLVPPPEAREIQAQARRDAERALALDSRCGSAAVAIAYSAPACGAFLEQDDWLSRALSWAPSDSFATRYSGMFAYSVGRGRESVALLRHAAQLDPLSPEVVCSLGAALNFAGELDEADTLLTDALGRWPDFMFAASSLVYTLTMKRAFARAHAVLGRYSLGHYERQVRSFLEACEGDTPAAGVRLVAALHRQFSRSGRVELDALVTAAHFGQVDEAHDLAELAELGLPSEARDARAADVYFLRALFTKLTPEIRRSPRFVNICARLGLVDYWLATQKWPDCAEEVAPWYDFKAACRRAAEAARQPL